MILTRKPAEVLLLQKNSRWWAKSTRALKINNCTVLAVSYKLGGNDWAVCAVAFGDEYCGFESYFQYSLTHSAS